MRPAVKLDNPFGVNVQIYIFSQNGRSCNIFAQFFFEFPVAPDFALLGSKFLNILFYLLTKKDFLQTNQRAVLKWQLFVVKQFIEVGAKLGLLELKQAIGLIR